MNKQTILAIETSCDETAIAIIEKRKDKSVKILSNVVLSQAEKHAPYGGVFPSLAKREHAKNLTPVLERALKEANLLIPGSTPIKDKLKNILSREPELQSNLEEFFKAYSNPQIDHIVVTQGPGLEPALWVGINFAKALGISWSVSVGPVNHLEGHICSVLMPESEGSVFTPSVIEFPALALLVSGKHTELVLIKPGHTYEIIGRTQDDATGEAFDKVARMLGLPYPGGPHVEKLASLGRPNQKIKLPRPMITSKDYNFSFSGLKTAVLYLIKNMGGIEKITEQDKADIALEFQQAVFDVLLHKSLRAIDEYSVKTLIVSGGVSASSSLKNALNESLNKLDKEINILTPKRTLATDNALMIALAGIHRIKKEKQATNLDEIQANGRWNLKGIN